MLLTESHLSFDNFSCQDSQFAFKRSVWPIAALFSKSKTLDPAMKEDSTEFYATAGNHFSMTFCALGSDIGKSISLSSFRGPQFLQRRWTKSDSSIKPSTLYTCSMCSTSLSSPFLETFSVSIIRLSSRILAALAALWPLAIIIRRFFL